MEDRVLVIVFLKYLEIVQKGKLLKKSMVQNITHLLLACF